ncbi:hypothetical protein LPJ70_006187, partial [Coemansia sp. RSA 2708]
QQHHCRVAAADGVDQDGDGGVLDLGPAGRPVFAGVCLDQGVQLDLEPRRDPAHAVLARPDVEDRLYRHGQDVL